MLQIQLEKPGQFIAVDRPEPIPGDSEALVRVDSIGVCGTDLHAFAGRQPFSLIRGCSVTSWASK